MCIRDRLVSKNGKVIYNKSFGYHTYEKKVKLENDHVFDLSSITKIIATMPLVLQEHDKGELKLNTKLSELFPNKRLKDKGQIPLREMLSHYAKLRPWIPFYEETLDRKEKPKSRFYKSNSKSSFCLLYTSPSPRDRQKSRMPSSA